MLKQRFSFEAPAFRGRGGGRGVIKLGLHCIVLTEHSSGFNEHQQVTNEEGAEEVINEKM